MKRWKTWVTRAAVGYLALLAAVTLFLHLTADVTPAGTVLMFAPRWVFALPLLVLLPLVAIARSRIGIAATVVAALVAAGPLTGGTLSLPSGPSMGRFRVVTLNCDGKSLDRPAFAAFLRSADADIVFLQESNAVQPADLPPGWFNVSGENGLRLASRHPVKLEAELFGPEFGPARGAARFTVQTPTGDLEVVNIHLPTPRHALEAVLHQAPGCWDEVRLVIAERVRASASARRWVGPPTDRRIVAGDFNLPPESAVLARDWSDYTDAFRSAGTGWGKTFSARTSSVRIDRVLVAPPWRVIDVSLGPDVGSAHRLVIADLDFGPTP